MSDTFREHASGLLVPNALSREREVWTHDEYRFIHRAMKLLKARGIKGTLFCRDDRCEASAMELVPDDTGQQMTWRCAHKDRVMMRAF